MSEGPTPAFSHLMVDLETVGTGADAPIVQVAAVRFDPLGGIMSPGPTAEFFRGVELTSPGQGPIDPATLLWWLSRNAETRTRVFLMDNEGGCPPRLPLRDVLVGLAAFMCGARVGTVWANAPTFDNTILREAAKRCGVSALSDALHFPRDRCFRTLRALGRDLDIAEPGPLPGHREHDALCDARQQARHASVILRTLATMKAATV